MNQLFYLNLKINMNFDQYTAANLKLKETIEKIETWEIVWKIALKLAKALVDHYETTRPDPKIIPTIQDKDKGTIFLTEHLKLAERWNKLLTTLMDVTKE